MRWKHSPQAVLAALLVVHAIAHIDRHMLLGLTPQITLDLAISNAQYVFLAGAVWVLSFGFMAVFLGSLANRFSRTRVIAAGILIWSVCTAASGAAATAQKTGVLDIVFGVFGSAVGGVLSDRLARRLPGGHAGFVVLLILICGPLMVAYRFAEAGSPLFYVGMCAGFFLPLATYGPSLALIQGLTPDAMRSTITGVTMLLINVFAIAIGNLVVGGVSDRLAAAGAGHALTYVLLATDLLVICAALFYALAARGPRLAAAPQRVVAH